MDLKIISFGSSIIPAIVVLWMPLIVPFVSDPASCPAMQTLTTNEFACGDRARVLIRINGSDVHHVVDPAWGFEHHCNCLRRYRTRHAQSLGRCTASCGVQRMAVYVNFHCFQRLLAGRENEAAVVGVLRTSAVAHLYRRHGVLATRSYGSAENIRPTGSFVRLLCYFRCILRERQDRKLKVQ